jgi:OmpA-OmpF porin, OOP family
MKYASIAAVAAALIATPVGAQWYAGAGIGSSELKRDDSIQADQFLDLGFESATSTSDKRDVGFRMFGGYQLHRNFAIEAAYVNLGKSTSRSDVMPTGSLSGVTKTNGFEVSAVGMLPISERFGAFARLGAFSNETKTTYSGTDSVEVIVGAESQKKRSTQLSYGAGVTYNFNTRVALRAEWARFTKLGDALTGGQGDANLYLIGIAYRF